MKLPVMARHTGRIKISNVHIRRYVSRVLYPNRNTNCAEVKMLQPLFDYQGSLPECPIWCERTQTLYWTDINRKQLHAYALQTGDHHTFHFEEEVGSFALGKMHETTSNGAAYRQG